MIRRVWTAREADEWTKEDWVAIVLSPLCYILLMLGAALSLLLQLSGYIMLGTGVVLTAILHWVIDPKLQVISTDYETRQQSYLQELEAKVRWQAPDRKQS